MTTTSHPARLRRRLAISFVAVAGLSAGALAVGADVSVHSIRTARFYSQSRDSVRVDLRLLASGTAPDVVATRWAGNVELGGSAVVVMIDGIEVSSVPTIGIDDVPASLRRDVDERPGDLLDALTRVEDSSALVIGTSVPGSDLQVFHFFPREEFLRGFVELRQTLVIGWLVVVATAGVAGSVVARRTLRPVRTASDAARSVAEGLLETRLPVGGDDEFGEWAAAFNEMVGALESKIEALADSRDRERRFTADVAHELRTPLGAVLTAASHLSSRVDDLPADAREVVDIIVAASRRLDRLSSEYLELHRLESGEETTRIEPTDLRGAVRSAIDTHGWTAQIALAAGPAAWVDTDRRWLDRIVVNLLANAVHHGGSGVTVDVTGTESDATIAVSDTGPGIAADALPKLFDRHFRASLDRAQTVPSTSASGGSGLGLSIALSSAHLLGGRLDVESTPGTGTVFRLTLPRTTGSPTVPPCAPSS